MNKMKKYLLMFAAIVAATLGFTACSSADDLANDEQEPEQERGVVKAEFTISLPKKVGTTRMSAATVQAANQTFRGIRNIELYPFVNKDTSQVNKDVTIPSMIPLLAGATSGKKGASSTNNNEIVNGALFSTSNSHLYQNVDIPLHTQSFMFYGEAIPSDGGNAVNGALNKSIATSGTTLDAITFNLQQICPNSVLGDNATAIATYLTSIANATGWAGSNNVALQSLYQSFINMKAGSWASIKGAVQKLYTSLAGNGDAVSTAIKNAIKNSTYASLKSGSSTELEFQALGNYPADINLPDGAAYLAWQKKANSETEYEFVELANNDNSGMNVADVTVYAYPASLRYYVLSDIVTSDQSQASLYVDGKEWKKDIIEAKDNQSNLFYNKAKVESTTRSIAIKDQIQYAVGRLDVTVKANASPLQDYNKNNVIVGSPNFPLTGVLIGGQKPVDYKFQQTTGDTYTIYDKNIASSIYLTTSASDPTYTLVLETKDAKEVNQTDAVVKIALEFQNDSGSSFIGYNGQVIYPGAKFYLVGMLDPYNNTTQKYVGTNDIIKKAFVQDYNTTANIVVKSFAQAYNVLPDLTLPSLEMGLSIDLDWKPGIIQDINIE